MGNCMPTRPCFLDVMPANMGGFSIFTGSWGSWISAVCLSVCLPVGVCASGPYVFLKSILGATLAPDLSVQTGCLLCLSLSDAGCLYTKHTNTHSHTDTHTHSRGADLATQRKHIMQH